MKRSILISKLKKSLGSKKKSTSEKLISVSYLMRNHYELLDKDLKDVIVLGKSK